MWLAPTPPRRVVAIKNPEARAKTESRSGVTGCAQKNIGDEPFAWASNRRTVPPLLPTAGPRMIEFRVEKRGATMRGFDHTLITRWASMGLRAPRCEGLGPHSFLRCFLGL